MVLSHDTSSCSCSVVALPPPSHAVLALLCVWTPVMRAAVCLLYVSAVKHRRVDVLHVRLLRHSLAVCSCCDVVVVAVVCTERLFGRAWRRCRGVVTCASVVASLACVSG